MKRKLGLLRNILVMVLFVLAVLAFVCISSAEDSKEILTLKRDLAQERVARLQAQLSLMQQQFAEGQKYLQDTQKELSELNAKLQAMEPKKEEVPKPVEKKK